MIYAPFLDIERIIRSRHGGISAMDFILSTDAGMISRLNNFVETREPVPRPDGISQQRSDAFTEQVKNDVTACCIMLSRR